MNLTPDPAMSDASYVNNFELTQAIRVLRGNVSILSASLSETRAELSTVREEWLKILVWIKTHRPDVLREYEDYTRVRRAVEDATNAS